MKPFEFKQADSPWPVGSTLLHVYVVVDAERDKTLLRLVDGGKAAVADFPITPVEHRWLHLTIDQVTASPPPRSQSRNVTRWSTSWPAGSAGSPHSS